MMKPTRILLLSGILFYTSCAKDTVEFNPAIQYGSFTDDRNGEVYKTVQIGDQTWMAENMRSLSDDPNEVNCCNYGKLFKASELEEVCPEGWHLPDTAEWQILINYLDVNNEAGGKLKETGDTHWDSPNSGATNSSGFTALGAGSADYLNGLNGRKKNAEFWTSTKYTEGYGPERYYISLSYDNEQVSLFYCTEEPDAGEKKSVRCIKN